MSNIEHLSLSLESALIEYCPLMYKNPRKKLSIMIAALIEARSCQIPQLGLYLPLESEDAHTRYMWIERFLSADTIKPFEIMQPFVRQALALAGHNNQTIVISIDQTCINNTHGIAMVSVRINNRGLPLFWHTEQTAGNIATSKYLDLLDKVYDAMPENANVLLMADRFFDASALINKCMEYNWGWRIRLKQGRILVQEEGEITAGELMKTNPYSQIQATIGNNTSTYVGGIHEKGHAEAWIIAMDQPPNKIRTLDYGLRWGIEAMFSDFKTRGFNLENTHILRSDRLDRMVLVVAGAMHWCVSIGLKRQEKKHLKQR